MNLSHIPVWVKWAFGLAGGVGLIWKTVGSSARGAGEAITSFLISKLPDSFRKETLQRPDEVKSDLRAFEQGAEDAIDKAAKDESSPKPNPNPPPAT